MIAPRWRKILRDLWGQRTRTALMVLSIAVGVMALGVVSITYVIVTRDLPASYRAANPASARLYAEPFDDALVAAVRAMPGVGAAEGRRTVTARVAVQPAAGDGIQWRDIDLFAAPDFAALAINRLTPERGAWPPGERDILIERAAMSLIGARIGDKLLIRLPNDVERELTITGVVHDITQSSARFVNRIYGYISFDSLEWLGMPETYTELQIIAAENPLDQAHVTALAAQVRERVEKSGRAVFWVQVPQPGKHPFERFVAPMALLLSALGLLALLLSGLLVVNTISALLAQQVRQIGVMKAIGARSHQIAGLYLGMVLVLGLLALGIALPAGMAAARAITGVLAGLINFDITTFAMPIWVWGLQAGAALLAPLLAALWPIRSGTRITVREAITSYGLGAGHFGRGRMDRLLAHIRGLSRPMALALRNTFRRKGRLTLTLLTLGLGSTIFVAVFSVRASLLLTLDDALNYWQYDVGVFFNRSYRVDELERQARAVAGVTNVESWGYGAARRVRSDGSEGDTLAVIAPPAATQLLQPDIWRGRWLLPEDENALVINTDVLQVEPDVRIGQTLTLVLDGRSTDWIVVGIIRGVLSGPAVYANYPYYARQAGSVDRAASVQVVTAGHTPAEQAQVARALEQAYAQAGLRVNSTQTTADVRSVTINQFNVILLLLLLMAVVLAVVGAFGLAGTMSINVMERTREIGVLRAVGATGRAVRGIVISEGVLIGLLSWALGVILAVPVSRVLSNAVGVAFLRAPLSYTFSLAGAFGWLAALTLLAVIASVLPARRAARLSVREALAYE